MNFVADKVNINVSHDNLVFDMSTYIISPNSENDDSTVHNVM